MTWTGATLYKSSDAGVNYASVLASVNPATIGTASSILGNFLSGNIFDELNSVTVIRRSGLPLVSYTEVQVLNGDGLCVIGVAGRWEVLQYKSATLTGVNTYKLKGFLRGRRGTEWAMGLHATGDAFVLIDNSTLKRSNPGSLEIGLDRLYKGVTSGTQISAASQQSFTNKAVGLECYSPVHIGGGRS